MGTAPVFDTASTVVRVVSIVSQLLVVSQKVNSLEDDKFWTLFMSGVTIMIADVTKIITKRYFTSTGSWNWYNSISKLVYNYNHTKHSTIKCTPPRTKPITIKKIQYKLIHQTNLNLQLMISRKKKIKLGQQTAKKEHGNNMNILENSQIRDDIKKNKMFENVSSTKCYIEKVTAINQCLQEKANDDGKEKESVDMDLEKNESSEDVVKLVESMPLANILDQIISSMSSRFEGARKMLADLSFFSYERLISINEGCSIPEDCFIYLKTWIPNIEIDELKMEYITFAKCFMELKNGINIKKLHNKSEPGDENYDDELHVSSSDTETGSNTDAPKITAFDIIKFV
ncbi:hypothetical protein QTP88_027253 [Uroleucon formosanum]